MCHLADGGGLCVEVDGDSHADKIGYDEERTRILKAYGLHIIRYTNRDNRDVLSNPAGVYQHLTTEVALRQQTLSPSSDKGRLGGVSSAQHQRLTMQGER